MKDCRQRLLLVLVIVIIAVSLSAQQNSNSESMQQLSRQLQQLQKIVQEQQQQLHQQQQEIESLRRSQKLRTELKAEVADVLKDRKPEKKLTPLQALVGLEVNLYLSWIVLGTEGLKKKLSQQGDRVDGTMTLDLALTARPIENGTAYVLLEAGSGRDTGLDSKIGTFGGIIDESGEATEVRLSEAWYEHSFFQGLLRVRLGKIDFYTDFDQNAAANDGTYQFVATPFVNNPTIEMPNFPLGSFVTLAPLSWMEFGIGVADGDGDWHQIFDNVFAMAELRFNLNFLPLARETAEKWAGNYRFYYWVNDSEHADLYHPDKMRTGYGFGISFDQRINDMFILFLRYGHRRDRVYSFSDAISAGVEILGKIWKRQQDALGIGWSRIFTGRAYHNMVLRPAGVDSGDEKMLEIYYRLGFNEYLSLSAVVQIWRNAEGDRDHGTFTTFGVRGSVYF